MQCAIHVDRPAIVHSLGEVGSVREEPIDAAAVRTLVRERVAGCLAKPEARRYVAFGFHGRRSREDWTESSRPSDMRVVVDVDRARPKLMIGTRRKSLREQRLEDFLEREGLAIASVEGRETDTWSAIDRGITCELDMPVERVAMLCAELVGSIMIGRSEGRLTIASGARGTTGSFRAHGRVWVDAREPGPLLVQLDAAPERDRP